MSDTGANKSLVLERLLDAPRSAVWRCWAEPDLLEKWFCPKPWFVTDARLELQPGGAFHTVMNGPDGERVDNVGVVLDVEPFKRLVFTDAFSPGWRPSAEAFTTTHVSFEDAGAGKTLYRAQALHWSQEAADRHQAMGFQDGWGMAAEQLEDLAKRVAADTGPATTPTIYLTFQGDCLDAVTHYAAVLGGTVRDVMFNKEAPTAEARMEGPDDMVLNLTLDLGATTLMASDAPKAWYSAPQGFSVNLSPTSLEEFDRLFAALAEEAHAVMMAPAETFWAERFTMFTDRWGTPWMRNFAGNKAQA